MNSVCRTALIFSFSALCSCSLFRSQPPTETEIPQEQSSTETKTETETTVQQTAQVATAPVVPTPEPITEPFSTESEKTEITPFATQDNEAPEEEQIAPPPPTPAAELRGLRSPKMPSALPMSLDGKVQN